MRCFSNWGLILLVSLLLSACGGGGGSTQVTAKPNNQSPVAQAGADQSVDELTTVTLDGSSSKDSDGAIASYAWKQTVGTAVTLSESKVVKPTFKAPDVAADEALTFELIVTDDKGAIAKDLVSVKVKNLTPANVAPTANAGAGQTVDELAKVTLDGSGSKDTDGSIVGYEWKQTAGTTVTLSDVKAIKPTFIAPDVAADETLTFELNVTDDKGAAGKANVSVLIKYLIVKGEVVAGVKTISEAVLNTPSTVISSPASGGVVLTVDTANAQGLAKGDIVFLPPLPTKGLPFSFVGKISVIETNTGQTIISLLPANVEDAYKSLSWDIDTTNGAVVAGVIAQRQAKVSFKANSIKPAAASFTNSLVVEKDEDKGEVSVNGILSIENEFEYKGKKIILFAEVGLDTVKVRSKGDYDITNIASDNGWAELTAVIKGDAETKVGLRAEDVVELPTIADLLKTNQAIWDELQWTGSDTYTLQGLSGDDKKGLYPLGGVVLTPCPAGICPMTFKGDLNNPSFFSALPTVILWVYIDINGKISISGEFGARVRGYHFEQGYEFKAIKSSLSAKRIDVATPSAVELYGNTKLDVNQRLGISLAADILVGGIRPAAINSFIGAEYEGKMEGDFNYAIVPNNGWSGYYCIDSELWAGVQLDANFRIKAKLPVDLYFTEFEIDGIVERSISEKLYSFIDKDLGSICLVSGVVNIDAAVAGADPKNMANVLVDVDFSSMYNNANVQFLTEKWQVVAECSDCPTLKFEIPSYRAGLDQISLPAGKVYILTAQALNDNDIVIKEASVISNVDYTADIPKVTATSGDAHVRLEWTQVEGTSNYAYCYSKSPNECLLAYDSTKWKSIDSGNTTLILTGLENGSTYYFRLVAMDKNGNLKTVSEHINYTPQENLAAPKNIRGTPSDSQLALTWDNVTNATAYGICLSIEPIADPSNCETTTTTRWLENQTSPTTIGSLENGKPYYFTVTAIDKNGNRAHSAMVSAIPVKEVLSGFNNLTPEVEASTLKVGVDTKDGTLKLAFNDDETNNQTFPYIWIANSDEGTISKLDVKTGIELGRYLTGPGNGNPSRTTVDQDGNVWVGNRNNNTITKVGLLEFGQCIDRNKNNKIDTSTGGADVRPWGGTFGDGQGITYAEDECVLHHVNLVANGVSTPSDIRMLAIDKDNNVFAGGHFVNSLFKVNGATGQIINAINTDGSFYGGLVDRDGNVWAVNAGGGGTVISVSNDLQRQAIHDVGITAYGIALDQDGYIWVTAAYSPSFVSFNTQNPANTLQTHTQQNRGYQPCYAQGIAVDSVNNVFIAGCHIAYDSVVGHYKRTLDPNTNTMSVDFVANYPVNRGPTGVAVDSNGNVWSANRLANSVSKITLAKGDAPAVVEHFPVGSGPYNYSDMTGRVVRTITSRQGTWEAIFDSKVEGYNWKQVRWRLKTALPAGTGVQVYAKTAISALELNAKPYIEVQNGINVPNLESGRYLKLKIRLTSDNLTNTPEVVEVQLY